ncbi:MAG: phosphatase PAP2 family protein [Myxococcaceae bacterium]
MSALAAIAVAVSLSAAPADAPKKTAGAFVGDDFRYRQTGFFGWWQGVLTRPFIDLASIPTSLVTWDRWEWTAALVTLGSSVAMAVPVEGRSLDSRIQDGLHQSLGVNCDYDRDATFCSPPPRHGFHIWHGGAYDAAIIGVVTGLPLALLFSAALGHHEPLVEAGALAIEAFLVTEAYHISTKLLLGREAPLSNGGAGAFHGPTLKYWPDGWPSGHAGTLFSIATVYGEYFENPYLEALLLSIAGVLSVFLVLDDAHFTGEVIAGAALGYFTGRWVVRHRSSHYHTDDDGLPVKLVSVAPMQGAGLSGLALTFAF